MNIIQFLKSGITILFLIWGIFSCTSMDVEFVAHRGASYDAPENTIAAFNLAWQQGADAIEGDFYLTKDSAIVCIHDKTTERTAGVNLKIAESITDHLRDLDVGSWKGDKWAGEKIPTIQEVFDTVPKDKKILIEIKCGPEIVNKLKYEIKVSGLESWQLIVISFNSEVIAEVKKHIPEIKAYWLTGFKMDKKTGEWQPSMDRILSVLKTINADGLDCRAQENIDENFVGAIEAVNMELHVWTIDDPGVAERFINLGVKSITTNRPEWLRQQVRHSSH